MPRSIFEDIGMAMQVFGLGTPGKLQKAQLADIEARTGLTKATMDRISKMTPEEVSMLREQVLGQKIGNRIAPRKGEADIKESESRTAGNQSRTTHQDILNSRTGDILQSQLDTEDMQRMLIGAQTGNVGATQRATEQGTKLTGEDADWARNNPQVTGGAVTSEMIRAQQMNQQMSNAHSNEMARLQQQKMSDFMNMAAMNPSALGMEYGKPDAGLKQAFEGVFPRSATPVAGKSEGAQRLIDMATGKAPQGVQGGTSAVPSAGISDLVKTPDTGPQPSKPTGGNPWTGWEYSSKAPKVQAPTSEGVYTPMGAPPELPQPQGPMTLADKIEAWKRQTILPKVEKIKNRPLIRYPGND